MSSKLVSDFLVQLEMRYSNDADSMGVAEWLVKNTTLNKKPFSFEQYPFQVQITNDMHQNLSCEKCSQVGLTEVQVRKFLATLRRTEGIKAIFSLPGDDMFRRVSQTRILPIVKNDQAFNLDGEEKSIRSRETIQIGNSFGFVTGCTEGAATSIDADFLFHDEVDLSPKHMLALFQSRLQNSSYKVTQNFSTPTHVDYGINALYKISDQNEFMIKCDSCNHWQVPLFTPDFVCTPGLSGDTGAFDELETDIITTLDLEAMFVCCSRCRHPLDLGGAENREWVPRRPEVKFARGYKVRPFSASRISPGYIFTQLVKYRQRDFPRGWHNTVLGEPYTEESARLTEAIIKMANTGNGQLIDVGNAPVFVGIDMGQTCHLTLATPTPGDGLHVFWFEAIPSKMLKERVAEIIGKYNVIFGTCDRHPYEPLANDLRDMTDGLIMPAEYRGSKLNFVKNELEEYSHIQCPRTHYIDLVASAFRKRMIKMSGYSNQFSTITEHLRNMVRVEEPEKEAVWVKLDKEDHYFHSLVFLWLAFKAKHVFDKLNINETRFNVLISGIDDRRVGNEPRLGQIKGH